MSEGQISPWLPEQDRLRLALLGKLIEELNEAGARAARCVIHGMSEVDPDTGRTNELELERELADVEACIAWLRMSGTGREMPERVHKKFAGFLEWEMLIQPQRFCDGGTTYGGGAGEAPTGRDGGKENG